MQLLVETEKRVYTSDKVSKAEMVKEAGGEANYRKAIAQIVDMCQHFSDLTYLSLIIGGETTIINPAFIHSIRIKDVAQEDMP